LLSLKTLIEARKLSDILFSFWGSVGLSKTPEDDLNHPPELMSIVALTAGAVDAKSKTIVKIRAGKNICEIFNDRR